MISIVERDPYGSFGSREQQTLTNRIFAHRVYRGISRQAFNNQFPGLSAIMCAVNIWTKIIDSKTIHRSVCRLIIELRRSNLCDFAPWAQIRRSDVSPIPPAVASFPDESVIRSRPDRVLIAERWRQRIN